MEGLKMTSYTKEEYIKRVSEDSVTIYNMLKIVLDEAIDDKLNNYTPTEDRLLFQSSVMAAVTRLISELLSVTGYATDTAQLAIEINLQHLALKLLMVSDRKTIPFHKLSVNGYYDFLEKKNSK